MPIAGTGSWAPAPTGTGGTGGTGSPGPAIPGGTPGGSGMVTPPPPGTGGGAGVPSTGGSPSSNPLGGGTAGSGLGGSGGVAMGGTGGSGTAGTGVAGSAAPIGDGMCCSDGNCLCHGDAPSALTSADGPYQTDSFRISTGNVHYPTDAEPPFAVVALCGGFLNTGPEMEGWGPFYASYGIVTIITDTTGADLPDLRGAKLLAALDDLKANPGALEGKLSDRRGTSGYSMGGGGTTIASGQDSSLKTSVALAPWGGVGNGVSVPTLILCGDADVVAPCDMPLYTAITGPKIFAVMGGATHFNWFGPLDAGSGAHSGGLALAFQKVFLEGDERWRPLLGQADSVGSIQTNIQ